MNKRFVVEKYGKVSFLVTVSSSRWLQHISARSVLKRRKHRGRTRMKERGYTRHLRVRPECLTERCSLVTDECRCSRASMDWTISEFGRCVGLVRERRSLVGQAEMNLRGTERSVKRF